MYAVAKGHRNNKLIVKTRRAPLNQSLDRFDTIKKDTIELNEICTIKKPVVNGKIFRPSHEEEISAQHEAMIRYINDSWRRIQQDLDSSQQQPHSIASSSSSSCSSTSTATVINTAGNSNNNPLMGNNGNAKPVVQLKIKHINGSGNTSIPKNFVPFDLESYFGQRFIQKLLQSS